MVRFILRLLALVLFATAVLFGVIDAARSLGDGTLTLTSLSESLAVIAPDMLDRLGGIAREGAWSWLTPDLLAFSLSIPTCIVAVALSTVFYVLGARRRRPAGRFSLD